eukprot:3491683-Pyramimonas_sp.AAC.2
MSVALSGGALGGALVVRAYETFWRPLRPFGDLLETFESLSIISLGTFFGEPFGVTHSGSLRGPTFGAQTPYRE